MPFFQIEILLQVVEAAVIGIPDKKWTERPLLIAVPKKGQQLSSGELLSFFQVCPEPMTPVCILVY